MYILEQSITSYYWKPTQDYLRRRICRGRYREVGNTGIFEVFGGKNGCTTSYVLCDGLEPIGWIYLRRNPNWVAYEVRQTFIVKDYRGNGYAEKLYKAAINTDGVLLASGCSHTKYSMGLWKKFLRKKMFNIWAHDFADLRKHAAVEIDRDGEIECDLDVYHDALGKQDVRLIAQRK